MTKRPKKRKKRQSVTPTPTRVDESPTRALSRIKRLLRSSFRTYRKTVRELMLEVYRNSLMLAENTVQWKEFCSRSQWQSFGGERPDVYNQDDALRFAMRYTYGFGNKEATRKASHYSQ